MTLHITAATMNDYEYLAAKDIHLSNQLLIPKIGAGEILMLRDEQQQIIGWLRYGYFWDNTPFMNMLWLEENCRSRGYGKQAVVYWEQAMKQKGFELLMTSTQSDESAQHFYRRLGYRDAGSLLPEQEPLEIIFTKKI